MLNVILLGLVSFFADLSTEMVYPIIPLYLTSTFGATPALIGVIEGIAESTASLLKVFSGHLTDKYQKKKPIAFLGYFTTLLYKIALIFAGSWAGILTARVTDRLGKGIRTAPRDVLVCESTNNKNLGNAFGIHKALDMAGSATGIFLAYLLMRSSVGEFNYKRIFLISAIPSVIALIMLGMVKENNCPPVKKEPLHLLRGYKQLNGQLKLYLLITFIFTLGNSSNTFLLLRAKNVGFNDTNVILLYFIYNLVSSILAKPLGKLSDKIGRKKLLVTGYTAFACVYGCFAFGANKTVIITAFVLYGIYTALTAGVERAFIAEISPQELKGTMLGLQSTIVGISLLPASVIAGFLWNKINPIAPFAFGALLALLCAGVLGTMMKPYEKVHNKTP